MVRAVTLLLLLVQLLTLPGCANSQEAVPLPTAQPTFPEIPLPVTKTPEELSQIPPAEPVRFFTSEEKEILLKIGMSERGSYGCPECIALVMCTILNRVEAPKFGSTIAKVVFAQDQFTPVANGQYAKAKPNELCYDALEMVIYGWDESRGALYYEWCQGESWHSKNLQLLFQHCDIRFYA